MMTELEREGQAFPEVQDVRVERCSVFKLTKKSHVNTSPWTSGVPRNVAQGRFNKFS